jgi:AcrR family transcriptional regulator
MATADAQRNREREPEEIAKKAGVDPGTFYRHFPTREELLVAVYRSEMEKRATAERKLSDTLPPGEAFRAWLLLFVDAVETKQIIATVLNTLVGDPKNVFEASYAQIHEAIRALVKRAIKSGDIRKDLDPIDLLCALVGVANVATSPDWQQSARRLVYA